MKKAFTLAEIMIVLTIIGVLAGILVPIANNARPDESVMKFKKAHAVLGNIIHGLVASDKFYKNGDLGIRSNGDLIDGTHTGDYSYFCDTFADNLTTQSVKCKTMATTADGYYLSSNDSSITMDPDEKKVLNETEDTINSTKAQFDALCKSSAKTIGKEIVTTDGVVYYEYGNAKPFGTSISTTNTYTTGGCPASDSCYHNSTVYNDVADCDSSYQVLCESMSCYCYVITYYTAYGFTSGYTCTGNVSYSCANKLETHTETTVLSRLFSPPNEHPAYVGNGEGSDIVYKVFCVDVDGFDESKGSDNCDDSKDVCPFGYGIRADGKILPGTRADEWMEKGLQRGQEDN